MKYQKEFEELKQQILEGYRRNDCKRPVKGSKSLHILVSEREKGIAAVELTYCEQFRRMFGTNNWGRVRIFNGDLKEACKIAKEIKAEAPVSFKIRFLSFEELDFELDF